MFDKELTVFQSILTWNILCFGFHCHTHLCTFLHVLLSKQTIGIHYPIRLGNYQVHPTLFMSKPLLKKHLANLLSERKDLTLFQ